MSKQINSTNNQSKNNKGKESVSSYSTATPFPLWSSIMNTCTQNNTPQSIVDNLLNSMANLQDLLSTEDIQAKLLQSQELTQFLTQGLSYLLNALMSKQRQLHLRHNPDDSGNGFSPQRTLYMGTTPIEITIPRTRHGFYPYCLNKYQRYISEDYQAILYNCLLYCRSFSDLRRMCNGLNLPYSTDEVDEMLHAVYDEALRFNSRPLAADWLFVYMDAKQIDMLDEKEQICKATHFTVIGISFQAKKELILSKTVRCRESLEAWKEILLNLKERGLSRCLCFITDDFPGLRKLISGLFPHSDHQLCIVHLLRNAKLHLPKSDYAIFHQTIREICACSSFQVAMEKFIHVCKELSAKAAAFISHIQQRAENYLAFTRYPQTLWTHIRTTNISEGINNYLETIKRNSGGHFHSERELMVKTYLIATHLYRHKWQYPVPVFKAELHALLYEFAKKFELELTSYTKLLT